jgi:hypothetical protein
VSTSDGETDTGGILYGLNATSGAQMWALPAHDQNITVTFGLRYVPAIDPKCVACRVLSIRTAHMREGGCVIS